MKKRDALKGSEDSQRPDMSQLQANVRTGRRVALISTENVFVSRESIGSDVSDDVSNMDESSRRQSEITTLPGLSSEEMARFLKSAEGANQDSGSNSGDDDDDETRFPKFGQTLPGIDQAQMAALLKKHGECVMVEDDEDDRMSSPEHRPYHAHMTSRQRRRTSNRDEDETSSMLSSITE